MRLHIVISMYMRREKVNRDFVAMYKSRTAKSYLNERPHTLKILIRNTCRLDFFSPNVHVRKPMTEIDIFIF